MPEMTSDEWDAYGDCEAGKKPPPPLSLNQLWKMCEERGIASPLGMSRNEMSNAIVEHDIKMRRQRRLARSE